MRTIKANKLNLSSVMVDANYIIPVIKTVDIPSKELIYLVLKEEFMNAEEEDEIRLAYPKIADGQIKIEEEGKLNTYSGLLEKKKNLTIVE